MRRMKKIQWILVIISNIEITSHILAVFTNFLYPIQYVLLLDILYLARSLLHFLFYHTLEYLVMLMFLEYLYQNFSILHTNQQHLPSVLNNDKLIQTQLLSSRIDHTPFQLSSTLQTRALPFHIKFHRVPANNTVVSNSNMCSILLLLLKPLFWYLRIIVTIYNFSV